MGSGKLLLIFDGFGASLVLLFTGAVGRGKRCSPVPLAAASLSLSQPPYQLQAGLIGIYMYIHMYTRMRFRSRSALVLWIE